jgi:hypothetical protein
VVEAPLIFPLFARILSLLLLLLSAFGLTDFHSCKAFLEIFHRRRRCSGGGELLFEGHFLQAVGGEPFLLSGRRPQVVVPPPRFWFILMAGTRVISPKTIFSAHYIYIKEIIY